jgi:succinate-semialdehyde dehydrogenase/glutarate-semialdehyde dehydrogenase
MYQPQNAASLLERLLPLATASAGSADLISPLNGEVIAKVPISSETDIENAFAQARSTYASWSKVSLAERVGIIQRFHDLVLNHQAEVLDIIQWENGKARSNALDEVLDVALTCRYYARVAKKLLKPARKRGAFPIVTKTWHVKHPIGVIGVISPWNYPFTLSVSDYIPAILAGNTIVIKPDLQTPLTALWGLELLMKAGLPKGVINIVLGDGAAVGPEIVARADYIMFTGSTRVGRTVASDAGKRLIGASMELGGKNSLIIDKNCNLDFAVEIAVRGAFANSGQLCIGTERILVHEDINDTFTHRFVEAVGSLKVGNEIGWDSDIGPLINAKQVETAISHIQDALANGASVLVGGTALPEISPFAFSPTVLTDVPEHALVCKTETFAPVCAIYAWKTEEELISRVNDTDYGLNAGIVSSNIGWARELASKIRTGTVNINEAFGSAYASIDAPMGGMGQSGVGRRHGAEGLLKYTESQTVSVQRWVKLTAQWGMSGEQWARFTTRILKILKALRFR